LWEKLQGMILAGGFHFSRQLASKISPSLHIMYSCVLPQHGVSLFDSLLALEFVLLQFWTQSGAGCGIFPGIGHGFEQCLEAARSQQGGINL
jgi:hypothetical protein